MLAAGPGPPDPADLDRLRYTLSALLDDLIEPGDAAGGRLQSGYLRGDRPG